MHGSGVHKKLLFFLISFSLCTTLITTSNESEDVNGETIIEGNQFCCKLRVEYVDKNAFTALKLSIAVFFFLSSPISAYFGPANYIFGFIN